MDIGISIAMENAAAENKKIQQKKPTGVCFTVCPEFIILTICIIVWGYMKCIVYYDEWFLRGKINDKLLQHIWRQ